VTRIKLGLLAIALFVAAIMLWMEIFRAILLST